MKCDLVVGDKVTTTEHEYEFGIVRLTTFKCTLNNQMPTLTEHKEIKVTCCELKHFNGHQQIFQQ